MPDTSSKYYQVKNWNVTFRVADSPQPDLWLTSYATTEDGPFVLLGPDNGPISTPEGGSGGSSEVPICSLRLS